MTTSIVTGGAGFIGSHLCDRLLELDHRVVCVDNLCTGNRQNVAHLEGNARFTFRESDVRLPLHWTEPVDYIFHLASPASPVAYFQIPVETATVNAVGTWEMLKLAQRTGARFLLTSTSEIYGDPLQHPQTESYWGNVSSIGPRSCYDEGKRFAEALTMSYHRANGLDVRIVRIFNTYGPRSDPNDGRMVPNFIKQSLQGRPLTVFGDGSQTRSLCYVDDLVDGLMGVMFAASGNGEAINLGNPDEHTILEYAELIKELTGSSSEIVMEPAREEEPMRRKPDITKAKVRLGWVPGTNLREGLTETVNWFRALLAQPGSVSLAGGVE
ncbi:MAG TPA: UDP-glucuronic acid decarboxylase family protein [Dehalococcoidia bacterium]|jgi:nucleoside-diphosphate-sugar epimerase|nr:UDP-glucuronic acid decarboxylase family protein [Dehalococcoidia bacterium]